MSLINRKYFNEDTLNYLENSFKKAGVDKIYLQKLLEWLAKSPKWSTLRVNKNLVSNIQESVEEIQAFLTNSLQDLNQMLIKEGVVFSIPKCQVLNSALSECLFYESSKLVQTKSIEKYEKLVIIDFKCAQAIYRGADIFVPGIIALSLNAKSNDTISIFADLKSKCLKGSDANLYMKNNFECLSFIGNGWLLFDRDQIFKNSEIKSGVGVKIKELSDGTYIPSFDSLDSSKYYPQNLPSTICAKVLDPRPGQLILDMCAAPGGKTTHLAELINNQGRIIAFDKISSKISKMKELCAKLGAKCIECFAQDATKINFEIYKPESFDRILVDAPCSALGQRPLIFNSIDANQLKSYVNYQKMILDNAVKLLKPGGYMVFSTCTITIEENEEQVSWLLNKYKNMKLVDQEPFKFAASNGIPCDGLDESKLKLLQRFNPDFRSEFSNSSDDVFTDTNGFFISKFLKE